MVLPGTAPPSPATTSWCSSCAYRLLEPEPRGWWRRFRTRRSSRTGMKRDGARGARIGSGRAPGRPLAADSLRPGRDAGAPQDRDRVCRPRRRRRLIQALFGVGPEQLRDGEVDDRDLPALRHPYSTHVDAPGITTRRSEGACPGDRRVAARLVLRAGVVIDATDRADGESLSAADVEERVPRPLASKDIVLVHTGRDAYADDLDYIARAPACPPRPPAGCSSKACG